jgi:hypothetical protein
MVSIAGPAALLLLWSQNEAGVKATGANAPPTWSAAPQVVTQTATVEMEELRRRGLELLRTESPEGAPSPPLARGDRLELNDRAMRPDMLIATAGNDESVAAPALLPVPTAASPRSEAKVSKPEKVKERALERPVDRRHVRRALAPRRDRVRMANANYVQARRREPLPTTVPVEENSGYGSVAPWSSWKNDWDKLWSTGTEGK